jgi:uncharacterized membrane protein HdeD (DUF308 family)
MPESRTRQKAAYTPPPVKKQVTKLESPRWFAIVMVSLFIVGLAWIVTYYLSSGYPIQAIGAWNMLVGAALIVSGFVLSTRWR